MPFVLTEKQRENRKKGIGGSDAAVVLDIKPFDPKKKQYKTPLQLWLEKTGRIEGDNLDNVEPVIWGRLLEDAIIERYRMRTGYKVKLLNHTLKHKKYPWMIANLDGVVMEQGILVEAKSATRSRQWGKEGTDQIPFEYIIQVQHCLEVMSSYPQYSHVKYAEIPTFFNKFDAPIYRVERNLDIANHLIEQERIFWKEYVEKDLPPQPSSREDIIFTWPDDDGEIIQSQDKDAEIELHEYKKVKENLSKLEREKQELETKLTKRIANASGIKINNDLLTFKKFKSTRVLRHYERE